MSKHTLVYFYFVYYNVKCITKDVKEIVKNIYSCYLLYMYIQCIYIHTLSVERLRLEERKRCHVLLFTVLNVWWMRLMGEKSNSNGYFFFLLQCPFLFSILLIFQYFRTYFIQRYSVLWLIVMLVIKMYVPVNKNKKGWWKNVCYKQIVSYSLFVFLYWNDIYGMIIVVFWIISPKIYQESCIRLIYKWHEASRFVCKSQAERNNNVAEVTFGSSFFLLQTKERNKNVAIGNTTWFSVTI